MTQGRKIVERGLLLLLLTFISMSAQVLKAEQVDIGISESSTTSGLMEIKMRPDFFISGELTMTNIAYTVRWDDPDVALSVNYIYPYFIAPQGDPELYEGFYYLVFVTVPFTPIGTDILAGEERLIASFTFTGGSCASFEIINDAWTSANNGDVYFELQGLDKTGIIYEPLVAFGSYGGSVSGGSTITEGESTGTLTLENYIGTINKWQKRVDEGTWTDIENTSDTYSEIPSSVGVWEYRAEVQEGSCPAAMSIPAEVIVNPAPNTWTGSDNTDWFTETNWTEGVPGSTLSGIIPAAPSNQPQISGLTTAEVYDLTIETGAVLSIEADGYLTVWGTLTNSAGNSGLVIRSDASGTGSLIHSTTGVSATSERYINNWTTGNEDLGWHFLSSPVSSQPIRPEFIPLGNPLPTEIDFYKWQEDFVGPNCIGCWINTKDDVGDWNPLFEDNFVTGRGYLVAYTAPYGDMVKDFTGQLNVGDFTMSNLSHTASSTYPGWHLVGNPYASALDWTNGSWVKTNIGAIPQIWKESAASYELIDNIGGDNSIIPANNGFMVYTDADNNNTLTIPADARVHSAIPWYKSLSVQSIRLLANDLDKGLSQQTTLRENPDATVEFDLQYDSYFIAGYAPMFYSVYGENIFALNSMPEIDENTIIPLYFIGNGSENYNIELSSGPPDMDIILTDLKLNIITNLKEDPVYEFTADAGDDPHRFQLGFDPLGIREAIDKVGITGWYANNALSIKSEQNHSIEVYIYNTYGQFVHQASFTGTGTQKVQLNLPRGMYIAAVTSNNQVMPIKFFVAN